MSKSTDFWTDLEDFQADGTDSANTWKPSMDDLRAMRPKAKVTTSPLPSGFTNTEAYIDLSHQVLVGAPDSQTGIRDLYEAKPPFAWIGQEGGEHI